MWWRDFKTPPCPKVKHLDTHHSIPFLYVSVGPGPVSVKLGKGNVPLPSSCSHWQHGNMEKLSVLELIFSSRASLGKWKLLSRVWVFATLCMAYTVHGILQARILEWVAVSFSRGSSQPRGWTQASHIAGGFFTSWATREDLRASSVSSVVPDSLQPYGLKHTRPPCTSPTPRAYSDSCLSCRWCHPTISSSVVLFSSHLQSLPASGSFLMSQFLSSGGQSIGVSASASVLPMNIQDWFPLGWNGWISLQSKGLSRVFSNTTVQKHQFFSAQLSS